MSSSQFAAEDVAGRVTLEASQTLGHWRVRVVSTVDGTDGFEDEPFVIALEFATLDLVGAGWNAAVVLDETYRRLREALVAGYE